MVFLVRFPSVFQFLFMSYSLETEMKNKVTKKIQKDGRNFKASMSIYEREL